MLRIPVRKSLQLINTPLHFFFHCAFSFPFCNHSCNRCLPVVLFRILYQSNTWTTGEAFFNFIFQLQEKAKHFSLKTPSISLSPVFPRAPASNGPLSLSPGILHAKTQSFVLPISSSHFSFPIWWFLPLSHVVNSSGRKKLNQCFIPTPLLGLPVLRAPSTYLPVFKT